MFDAETTALLRAVLNEVCENVSKYENGARAHVASKILEAPTRGYLSERLRRRLRGKAGSPAGSPSTVPSSGPLI
jgi:hypothetical protein